MSTLLPQSSTIAAVPAETRQEPDMVVWMDIRPSRDAAGVAGGGAAPGGRLGVEQAAVVAYIDNWTLEISPPDLEEYFQQRCGRKRLPLLAVVGCAASGPLLLVLAWQAMASAGAGMPPLTPLDAAGPMLLIVAMLAAVMHALMNRSFFRAALLHQATAMLLGMLVCAALPPHGALLQGMCRNGGKAGWCAENLLLSVGAVLLGCCRLLLLLKHLWLLLLLDGACLFIGRFLLLQSGWLLQALPALALTSALAMPLLRAREAAQRRAFLTELGARCSAAQAAHPLPPEQQGWRSYGSEADAEGMAAAWMALRQQEAGRGDATGELDERWQEAMRLFLRQPVRRDHRHGEVLRGIHFHITEFSPLDIDAQLGASLEAALERQGWRLHESYVMHGSVWLSVMLYRTGCAAAAAASLDVGCLVQDMVQQAPGSCLEKKRFTVQWGNRVSVFEGAEKVVAEAAALVPEVVGMQPLVLRPGCQLQLRVSVRLRTPEPPKAIFIVLRCRGSCLLLEVPCPAAHYSTGMLLHLCQTVRIPHLQHGHLLDSYLVEVFDGATFSEPVPGLVCTDGSLLRELQRLLAGGMQLRAAAAQRAALLWALHDISCLRQASPIRAPAGGWRSRAGGGAAPESKHCDRMRQTAPLLLCVAAAVQLPKLLTVLQQQAVPALLQGAAGHAPAAAEARLLRCRPAASRMPLLLPAARPRGEHGWARLSGRWPSPGPGPGNSSCAEEAMQPSYHRRQLPRCKPACCGWPAARWARWPAVLAGLALACLYMWCVVCRPLHLGVRIDTFPAPWYRPQARHGWCSLSMWSRSQRLAVTPGVVDWSVLVALYYISLPTLLQKRLQRLTARVVGSGRLAFAALLGARCGSSLHVHTAGSA